MNSASGVIDPRLFFVAPVPLIVAAFCAGYFPATGGGCLRTFAVESSYPLTCVVVCMDADLHGVETLNPTSRLTGADRTDSCWAAARPKQISCEPIGQ